MTSATPRKREPRLPIEVRREQALNAAFDLLDEGGYAAVSMEAIARRVGVAKPVIYNAYPTLGQLMITLLEREQAAGLEVLARAMPPRSVGVDPAEQLLYWLRVFASDIVENPRRWRMILLRSDGVPDEVRRRVRDGREFARQQVRGVAASLMQRHPRFADLDLDLAASMILEVGESGARAIIADPRPETAERLIQFVSHLIGATGGSR